MKSSARAVAVVSFVAVTGALFTACGGDCKQEARYANVTVGSTLNNDQKCTAGSASGDPNVNPTVQIPVGG